MLFFVLCEKTNSLAGCVYDTEIDKSMVWWDYPMISLDMVHRNKKKNFVDKHIYLSFGHEMGRTVFKEGLYVEIPYYYCCLISFFIRGHMYF